MRAVAVTLALTALFAACSKSQTPVERATKQGILLFGNEAEPKGLDPHLVTGFVEQRILQALFEGLTTLDNQLNVKPGVAKSWEISDDKKVYTFHLNPNAKWSNGDPVTSQDFLFAWRRILTRRLGSKYAYMLFCIKNAEAYYDGKITDPNQLGAKALDDHTLQVTLKSPTPYFFTLQIHFTWFPLHEATLKKYGDIYDPNNPWTRAGNMVSNGPFKLVTWEPNQVIKTVKNEFYWDRDNVRLNGVNFYPIEDEQTEERSFRAGSLHMTSRVPPSKIATYRKEHPELLHIAPTFGTAFLRFNATRAPFKDKRVREALAMSINREGICKNILRGGEKPATAFTPPDPHGYVARASIPYDVKKARKLLAMAGYPGGKGFPSVTFLYNTTDTNREICESIQAMWKKNLGIEVTLVNQEWKVYLATMNRLDYDIARSSWWGDFLDPINFLECFETGSGNNRTGWSSPPFDALLAQARAEPNEKKRSELLQKAEAILLDGAPIAPVYVYVQKHLISPDVKGWHANLLSHINWKFMWLEPNKTP